MRRYIGATALIICAVLSFMGISKISSAASGINNNDSGYINFRKYCVEGAGDASDDADGAYVYKKYDGADTYLRMMYLSDSNTGAPRTDDKGRPIWVYCIEFGQEVNSNLERKAYKPDSDKYWLSLSDECRQGIALAALYGFGINTSGVSAADKYAAIQAVIWEFQTGVRDSLKNNSRQDVMYRDKLIEKDRFVNILKSASGTDRAAKRAYDALISKIYSHNTAPDFGTEKPILTFDKESKMYKAVITDRNGVLGNFSVESDNPELKTKVSGNDLILTSREVIPETELKFSRIMPEISSQPLLILRAASAGQISIVGQSVSPIGVSVKAEVEPLTIPVYELGIQKRGEILSGFTKEKIRLGESEYELNVPEYKSVLLPGCKVGIFAAEDIVTVDGVLRLEKDELAGTLITSSEEAVYINDLYAGQYYIKELEAPEGYIPEDNVFNVTLGDESGDPGVSEIAPVITIDNERVKVTASFTKVMENSDPDNSGNLLSKVSFGVYTSEGIGDLPAGSLVGVICPDTGGTCTLSADLPFGFNYYVKELSTADGYLFDDTEYDLADLDGKTIINREKPKEPEEPTEEITDRPPLAPEPPTESPVPETGDGSGKYAALYAVGLLTSGAAFFFIIKRNIR